MFLLKNYLEKAVLSVITVFLCLLVIMAAWQVFARYVLNDPPQFTDEALRYTMIWLVYLGAAYALSITDRHMSLTLIKENMHGRKRLVLETFNYLAVMVFVVAVFVIGGVRLVEVGVGQYSDSMSLPMNYVYAIIPIAGVLGVFFKSLNFSEVLQDIRSETDGQ